MLDCKKNDWQFGLMVRDITTTYNVWNIDEKEYQKIADGAWAKSRTTGVQPQSPNGTFKNSLSVMTIAYGCSHINMRFTKTNDLISTDFVSVDPALGFEFGYTDLVLSVQE
jgi:hypothetical protein